MEALSVLFLLQTIIKNEIQPLPNTREEFEHVRRELQRLRTILPDTDVFRENEEELKIWLQQVREVIQDCEDAFDELLILRAHDHGDDIFHKLSCCINNMKARYRLRSELAELNSRQEGKLSKIKQASKSKYLRRPGAAFLLEKSNLVGIDRPKKQVMQWLFEGSSDLEVISMVGMGGMGKTTLAKLVYDDPEVKKHFSTHAWITVSQSFDEQEILVDMVQQLYQAIARRPPKDFCSFKALRLKEIIVDLLNRKRFLIVQVWIT